MEVKIQKKIIATYLFKIWYVRLVGDFKRFKTLTFNLRGKNGGQSTYIDFPFIQLNL